MSKANNYAFVVQGNIKELFACRDSEVLLEGGSGTGKTRAVLQMAFFWAYKKYPDCRILLVRKTRTSMTTSDLVCWEKEVVPRGLGILEDGGKPQWRQSYVFPNGSELVLGGLDNSEKILSSQYDIVIVDEATEITEDEWEILSTRLRNGKMPYSQMIAVCNPASKYHWLNQRALAGKMRRLSTTLKDNPRYYSEARSDWTKEGKKYIKDRLEPLSGYRRKRFLDGIWAAAEGKIYEDFNEDTHIVNAFDTVKAEYRHIASVDWGHKHTGIIQVWAIDDDNRLYLVEEVYRQGKTIDYWIAEGQRLRDKYNIEYFVADSARPDNIALFKANGLICRLAKKDVIVGIQTVAQRLRVAEDGKPRLMFFKDSRRHSADSVLEDKKLPTCTVEEFDGYCWARTKDGTYKEEPIKQDDDGMDAMRYVCMDIDVGKRCAYVGIGGYVPQEVASEPEAALTPNYERLINDDRLWHNL
jgi:PBSX family phage terminase large subunit